MVVRGPVVFAGADSKSFDEDFSFRTGNLFQYEQGKVSYRCLMFPLRGSGLIVVERDDVNRGCGEIFADRLIDWHETQPDPWMSLDGDVGETVLP